MQAQHLPLGSLVTLLAARGGINWPLLDVIVVGCKGRLRFQCANSRQCSTSIGHIHKIGFSELEFYMRDFSCSHQGMEQLPFAGTNDSASSNCFSSAVEAHAFHALRSLNRAAMQALKHVKAHPMAE